MPLSPRSTQTAIATLLSICQVGLGQSYKYKAFISYSHQSDSVFASVLQPVEAVAFTSDGWALEELITPAQAMVSRKRSESEVLYLLQY